MYLEYKCNWGILFVSGSPVSPEPVESLTPAPCLTPDFTIFTEQAFTPCIPTATWQL